jgi:hypothetical protein
VLHPLSVKDPIETSTDPIHHPTGSLHCTVSDASKLVTRSQLLYARTSVRSEKKARPRLTLGIRLISTFFDSAQCLMVRRWRLIGYFPILYNPTGSHAIVRVALQVAEEASRERARVDMQALEQAVEGARHETMLKVTQR